MKIIKIDRKSIKRNPNAGKTVSHIFTPWNAKFEIESAHIPKWIYKKPFIITDEKIEMISSKTKSSKIKSISGIINGPFTDKQLISWKNFGLIIRINREIQRLSHLPEPDYLYDYEETFLKCKFCKNKVEVEEIETDWIMDEYEVKICPVCKHENTFPTYKHEKIEDLKKIKL